MEIRFRRWPWQFAISEENLLLPDSTEPFYVAPILELQKGINVLRRKDKIAQIGNEYKLTTLGYERKLYELSLDRNWKLELSGVGRSEVFKWSYEGLVDSKDNEINELIESWLRVFDELTPFETNDLIKWSQVSEELRLIGEGQPERSLIVKISEIFTDKIALIVSKSRKILQRKSETVRLEKFKEADKSFLNWYVVNSGKTIAEKAGNKRQVPGTIRFESYDTLENRVLKHFLILCIDESNKYINAAKKANYRMDHGRILQVLKFKEICKEQVIRQQLNDVKPIVGNIQPNYVLQNDFRYKLVWFWYQKLIRREVDKDKTWSWQGRIWVDVVRLFTGTIFAEKKKENSKFEYLELKESAINIHEEQISGRRLLEDTLPGPFSIRTSRGSYVLDIVDPSNMGQYSAFRNTNLSALAGHFYLVINPLATNKNQEKIFISVWALNRACSLNSIDPQSLMMEAHSSLLRWSERNKNIKIHGIVISNQAINEKQEATTDLSKHSPYVMILNIPNHPRTWHESLERFKEQMELMLEFVCEEH